MTLRSDAKIKVKLTCSFKYGMRNFDNFHPTTQKPKNVTLTGYFCPKYIRFELKNPEELSFMTLHNDAKFEWILTLWFQKWHEKLNELLLEHSKSEKLYIDGLFWQKQIMLQLEISEELCAMKLKGYAKFKGKLSCRLKNDI